MFQFEPEGTVKFIVFMDEHASYAEFNDHGIFVGDIWHLAETFPSINEYDDGEITKLATSLRCRAIFYHVPVAESALFATKYGHIIEPNEYETDDRVVFVTEGEGDNARSVPTHMPRSALPK